MEKNKIILKGFGLLVLFILLFLPGYSKYQELLQRNRMLEAKIHQLQLFNERLENEIKRLQEDPAYVEKVARDKLKVSKKDEIIYKVVEDKEGLGPGQR